MFRRDRRGMESRSVGRPPPLGSSPGGRTALAASSPSADRSVRLTPLVARTWEGAADESPLMGDAAAVHSGTPSAARRAADTSAAPRTAARSSKRASMAAAETQLGASALAAEDGDDEYDDEDYVPGAGDGDASAGASASEESDGSARPGAHEFI
ncbi:hypothetical protein MSPP1_000976 [Malassezia sp. CBS 17886]|nr:hypothetical protein MSPP1_000976 [Malassezia sp. CBS 17886]